MVGCGGVEGISSGFTIPTAGQTFNDSDFGGMGNSITAGWGIGPATIGNTYGGTQGNSFSDFGSKTLTNSRPYKSYGAGQSSQYPGIAVGGKNYYWSNYRCNKNLDFEILDLIIRLCRIKML